MIQMISVCEALWLSHEHILDKGALEEGIIDIKLTEAPSVTSGKRKDQTNSGWFHHQTEGVMIVNAGSLIKSLGNQPFFGLVHIIIR